jgi:dihydroorotase
VLAAGILPFTLGADLHGYNVRLKDGGRAYRGMFTGEGVDSIIAEDRASPFERPYSLHHAMTELVALGVPLVEVVRMATENAATMLGLDGEMGSLSVGMPADLSAMRLIDGDWTLVDSERVTHKARQLIHPEFALRAGKLHRADSPLLPSLSTMAA